MSDEDGKKHGHHILSHAASLKVFLFLLIFTVITVAVAQFNFGALNFPIAMLIATAKAMAVMLIFMGLKYDDNENRVIFFSGFVFFAIFIFFVAADFFSRPSEMEVNGPVLAQASGGVTFEKPWEVTDELLAHGEKVFTANACQTCHGAEGLGNGPAGVALGARNFTQADGWKNGRKPSQVYQTLVHGLGSMPAYPTLSASDRWAVAHYVLNFGPPAEPDDAESLLAAGVDLSKPNGGLSSGEEEKKTIPIDFALERYLEM